ncbi:hypothetical protein BKA67DRAFT_661047 [Truncatella angustata]|uniref:Uncharacterized protein n=1 Tax=Truncatella angustata TaxID=152316 RepID=A0A9P8UHG9_9PEZI|nr:uncharacterized protein BKA67DRAFT_661047 [Truncatella angustata]KAH6652299.1 hypothetical protein BKA67DRAFT_661047 [Truncatella angustata]KAH8205101.1 hypothetical protein TruAng_000666 [Truncatella angustata]
MQFSTIIISLISIASSAMAAPTDISGSAAVAVGEEKRFVSGWCGLHVKLSQTDSTTATVHVYDSKQFLIATESFSGSGTYSGTVSAQNGMGSDLNLNFYPSGNNDVATFEYGTDYWGSGEAHSSNSRCSVGQWDLKNVFSGRETLDMDCGFSC